MARVPAPHGPVIRPEGGRTTRGRLARSRVTFGALAALVASCAPPPVEFPGQALPARFEADRVFLDLPVPGSTEPLTLYTDTGGGLFVFGQAADRIGGAD